MATTCLNKDIRLIDNPKELIVNSLAILIGDYEVYRKKAALLILKVLIQDKFLQKLLNDQNIYPISRDDKRVREWVKKVTKVGKCEHCGSPNMLEAHHIIPWAEFPQGRVDIKNGACLCVTCHANVHKGERAEKLILSKT